MGSHLVDRLLGENIVDEIVVLDNLSSGSIENIRQWLGDRRMSFVKADLKEWNSWVKAFQDANIVFHLAANPEVRVSTVEPRVHFDDNVLVTFNVLEACRKYDVELIVFASSSTVYGDAMRIPTPEDHPTTPISIYGASKLCCEILISTYSRLYGIKGLVLRYANIIGPRSNHGVIIDFIRKLKANPHVLEILGDGTQRKSYLHVYDAIDATLHLTNYILRTGVDYDVFNVGNEDWISVIEIADIVVEEMGLKDVKYVFKPGTPDGRGWPGDVKFMLLDISKLKSTGWRPRWGSRDAVRLTVRQILNNAPRRFL